MHRWTHLLEDYQDVQEKLFEGFKHSFAEPCCPLVAKISVSLDFRFQILDLVELFTGYPKRYMTWGLQSQQLLIFIVCSLMQT